MTVAKFRQQSSSLHLPPPPIRFTSSLHIPSLAITPAKAEAKALLYISPFQTIFKISWGKLDMEWGDPFCSTDVPVQIQHFSGGCRGEAFFLKA